MTKPGGISERFVSLQDIYPTLAAIMDLKNIPEYLEGESFAGIVADPELAFRDNVQAVIRRGDFLGRMVKTKEWRYIEWDHGEKGIELYNQKSDPIEYKNLAQDPAYSEIIANLKAKMVK